LQARAVTRDLDGRKSALPERRKSIIRMFDAPIVISGHPAMELDTERLKPYWYDKDTKLVHFIGKDNIVFHCIIFPSC